MLDRSLPTDRVMTTPELAEFLKVPLDTVHKWRSRGTGPRGSRVGKHVRYRMSDILAWLDANADRPPAA
jgi:excisionase family DNA binding protein